MVRTRGGRVLTPRPARRTRTTRTVESFLDVDAMKSVLQSNLPQTGTDGFVIRDCVVDSVRYNSRAKDRQRRRPLLSVSYRLDTADRRGKKRQRIVYAEVYPGGPDGSRLVGPKSGNAIVHLPEHDAVVWEFPHDPQMPHLVEVMDPERAKHHLPFERLPAGLDAPMDAKQVHVEVLRYKPETHCAARHQVVWDGKAGPRALSLFGKTYAGDRGDEIHGQIEAVAQRSRDDADSFLAAGSLGYSRSVRTVWQAALAGSPLLPVLLRGDCDDVLKGVGTGLAILHETTPVTSLTVSTDDLLVEMQAQIDAMVEMFPELKRALEEVGARLREEAPGRAEVPATLVHGDLVAKNLLVQDGRLVICDFDDCAVGDPLQDLACFLVDLHFLEDRDSHLVTLRQRAPGVVESMAGEFLDAYRSRAAWPVPEDRLLWHWHIQLLAKIQHYCKRQHLRPGFEQDLGEMLALLG